MQDFPRRQWASCWNSKLLIIAGALDGASGLILSVNMSKAMNRSFTNVLFGAFGAGAGGGRRQTRGAPRAQRNAGGSSGDSRCREQSGHRAGYGMAVAQAQHKVRELYDALTKRGVDVKFGIIP